jgi:hypothetical protein
MELELVEPDLYLEHDPAHGEAFVSAIARAASVRNGNPSGKKVSGSSPFRRENRHSPSSLP